MPTPTQLDLDSLTALRVLGRGAMGTVFLVTNKSVPSSPPFALKVIPKNSPTSKPDSLRRSQWELHLLSQLQLQPQPFLPSLLASLDSPSFLAYALPFCPGGDLNTLRYTLSDRIFSLSAIRFYLSEILLAISHLHSLHIVYRDLKPENILIQSNGHLTLTDFDLSRHLTPKTPSNRNTCPHPPPPHHHHHRRNFTRIFAADNFNLHMLKKVKSAKVSPVIRRQSSSRHRGGSGSAAGVEKSHSFVGTEEYVAPEIVKGEGHDFGVDFWALGILTYEMAYGRTPFKGKNRKETFRNIVTRDVEFGGRRGSDLTDLIGRLLEKDVTKRLGCGGGAEEVKEHAFFRGVKWDMLSEVGRPPYFAEVEELEEAVRIPSPEEKGFDIREYFERIHMAAAAAAEETSISEF